LLTAQVPAAGQQDFRNWEWRYLWQASRGEQVWTLDCLTESVQTLGLLPGGRLVSGSIGFGEAPTLALWDLEQRKPIRTSNLEANNVSGLAISPDHRVLAVAKWGTKVEFLDADSLKKISTPLVHDKPIWRLAFSPDGKLLSAVGREELSVWDVATKTRLWSTRCVAELWTAAPFSRDGTQVLCPVEQDSIAFFQANDGTLVKTLRDRALLSSSLAFSPDGRWLAGGNWFGTVWLAELSNSQVRVITNRFGPVTALKFSPDGKHLALGYDDGLIRVLALDTREITSVWRGHSGTIDALIYSPDGKQLYSGGGDGTVRVWLAEPSVSQGEISPWPETFSINFITPYGRFLNDYNPTNRVDRILAFPDFKEVFSLTNGPSESFCVSPTGRAAAAGATDGHIDLWSAGKSPKMIRAHSNAVTAVVFSADGNLLASGAFGGEVCVWDIASLRPVLRRSFGSREYAGAVHTLAFSPDNRTLVVPTQGSIFLLDLRSHSEVREIKQVGYVASPDVSPDSTLLAVATGKEVRVWELGSLRPVARLRGTRTEWVLVTFSPDGSRLLASDATQEICLWDYRISRLVGRIEAGALSSFAFQPDGDTLVLTRHYGRPRFLSAPPWNEIQAAEKEEQFRREAFRNLPR